MLPVFQKETKSNLELTIKIVNRKPEEVIDKDEQCLLGCTIFTDSDGPAGKA